MKPGAITYTFSAKTWKYTGPAGWYFVSLPQKLSKEMRRSLQSEEQGWGRLKATAIVGNCEWQTAIWFDTRKATYLLPLKAEIRKKEMTEEGKKIAVLLYI